MAATLSPLTENENRRSILGYKERCMPALLHKAALREDCGERPRRVETAAHPRSARSTLLMFIDHGRAERHQIWRTGGPNSAR
jgi:hypothetical protein